MSHTSQVAAVTCLFVFLALAIFGQQTPDSGQKSLAEIAAQSKSNPAHAKIVLNDDSTEIQKPIIPNVFSNGLDNSDQITDAILQFQKTHTPQETEDLVHAWYDKHDALLARAIDENRRINDRAIDRHFLGPDESDARNYRQYQQQRMADMVTQRDEYKTKMDNGMLSARIQQTFTKVRSQLQKNNMRYEWFKIRCGNGNCSF